MTNRQEYDRFCSFMLEYVEFVEKMARAEGERLHALTGWDLPKLEKSIAASQANTMKLDNMEKRRLQLQQTAGFAEMSFRQILEAVPEDWRPELLGLLIRFEQAIQEIQYNNDKSMAVAKDNMMRVNPEAVLPSAQRANPYSRIGKPDGPVFKADV